MISPKTIVKNLRVSSIILKKNYDLLKKNFWGWYIAKWSLELDKENNIEIYDICQNIFSLSVVWDNQYFREPKIHFYIELINCFQALKNKENGNMILYRSYSQELTTFCLKMLARYNLIEIKEEKKEDKMLLEEFESAYEKKKGKERKMYTILFFKKRDLTEKDIPLLEAIAKILGIAFEIFEVRKEEDKIFLQIKKKKRRITLNQINLTIGIIYEMKKKLTLDLKNKIRRQEIEETLTKK